MPRKLILIPQPAARLEGATHIEPGYPKGYDESDMRRWAADVERLYATPPDEVARLRALPREQLTPDQRGVVAAHEHYFAEPSRGITGSLREDGVVELDTGRHRASYMLERGTDPIPVWVSARDQRALDAYAQRCRGAAGPARQRQEPSRPPPRCREQRTEDFVVEARPEVREAPPRDRPGWREERER